MWYSGRRHRSKKRTCFTLCSLTVLWKSFFVPVNMQSADRHHPRLGNPNIKVHGTRVQQKPAGEEHQTKAFTSSFVCVRAVFLSRWSAVTYSNNTIKLVCFWLSEQPVFLLVAKETDNTLTWDLQVCSVPQSCRRGQTADNNMHTVREID